ncbi:pentatricopeptide repeat-containing protein At1g71210, mitochondrial [Trifolium pratense]|uniref:pentatricopeptide repeat-containing protein At1g71210, mitochondrial n=1 Tax=Trifolium pratense TaxID=57577 RepID=UPI001E697682|nr:pentatricopeptide repeat-containing protein At1g71210, mitochondrial [Trifolium pratense]
MLPLKHVVTKFKSLFSSSTSILTHYASFTSTPSFSITQNDVASTFKTWFQTRHNYHDPLLLQIYKILSSGGDDFSSSLSSLSLPLTPEFVISVLRHGGDNNDIQSCVKFFDWAGRQPRFHHTRATFVAIFRILTHADHIPCVVDFLQKFRERVVAHRVRFNDTLVVGYAIAGKLDIALQVFGKMCFQGLDLDTFGYHILLNALAEDNYFNAFNMILNQIRVRGYATNVTDAIVVKFMCKQGRLDEAEDYLNGLLGSGKKLRGSEVGFLVGSLCERNRFEHAVELVKEFGNSGLVPMEHAYGVCVKGLVNGGRLDEALGFFRQKRDSGGYVPGSPRYNMLICRLLRESRLHEVYDLLMDMNESCIPPDMVTMNAVLCFFCKTGMVDVALQLYKSRSQFGLNPNQMAYKYLILTLCWDGSVKEAYSVLKSSIGNGLFLDTQTFTTLASALCRERKVDEMKELIHLAVERGFTPSAVTYDKFISALCQAGRVEDGYLIHGELNNATCGLSYSKMIKGFIKSKKGDIAARLLVEMKEKHFELTRPLYRAVICSLLDMDNPIRRVLYLLDMLTHGKPDIQIFNFFIDGAVHANKPDLARELYDLMVRCNIVPTIISQALVLISYLKSGRIHYALKFFDSLRRQGVVSKKLYTSMVIGLCKNNKADIARDFLFEMLNAKLNPGIECYESLVQKLCSLKRYDEAINLVQVYMKRGRRLTSFLGNIFLCHSLTSPDVYDICVQIGRAEEGESSPISTLSFVIGAFSGRLRVNRSIEELEELIAMCFPLDTYTYNLLLRRITNYDMNQACELVNRICQRGYEPNDWTYNIMVDGFKNHGRNDEAKQWVEEMHKKGFYPIENNRRNVR